MKEPFIDLFERPSDFELFCDEREYRVAFQAGDEAFADGHYVVSESEAEDLSDESPSDT